MNSFSSRNNNDFNSRAGFSSDYGSGFEDDFDDDFGESAPPAPPAAPQPAARRSGPEDTFSQPVQRRPRAAQFESDDEPAPAPVSAKSSGPLLFDVPSKPKKSADFRDVISDKTLISRLLLCLLAVFCLLSAGFVSSGDLLFKSDTVSDSLSASLDMTIGFENLLTNVLNTAHGIPKVYTLPMTDSPAVLPREENYSNYIDDEGTVHSTYEDETISVDCWRKRYYVNDVSSVCAIAKVKITHPTQLRTAFAGGSFGSSRLLPSVISKQVNAVVAINGELYNYQGKSSALIRQGTTYRNLNSDCYDILFIDSKGDFTPKYGPAAYAEDFLNTHGNPIYQTIAFGPNLVIDGEIAPLVVGVPENYFYRNPRSGIGQIGPLEYLLVAAEGRAEDSKGFTVPDFAILMKDLGCAQACNLDGGQSSMLIFHNKPYNNISNGSERTFSDIIYFGSALPY